MTGSAYDKLYTTQKRLDANRQAEKELNEQLALQEEERRQAEIARKRAEANWFERTMSTVGEIGVDFLYGAGKGIEGIIDFGAGIVDIRAVCIYHVTSDADDIRLRLLQLLDCLLPKP